MEEQQTKKQTMVMIKKRNLIFLLVLTLIFGGVVSGTLLYATKLGPNYVSVKKTDYKSMAAMQKKYAKLDLLWSYIDEKYYIPVDDQDLEEGIYKGLFAGLNDPYSAYLSKEEYKELMESTTGQYGGVGVSLKTNEDGQIAVVSVTENSPSAKAGIKAGDMIVAVDGAAYNGESIELAAAAMRGSDGSKVSVTIERDGQKKTYDMRRETITTISVGSAVLEGNIGYIQIASFTEQTAQMFKKELTKLEQTGVDGLVIDLRGNPGGLVESGVEVADMLLPAGIVTYTVDRAGEKSYFKSEDGATGLPYVVIINGGSASTSEILAAAVKDRKGGKLVGTTTYGKGIIQSIEGLKTGEALKLTIMQYFSPNGKEIHHHGVEPNIKVELQEEDYGEDGVLVNDRQLSKAVEVLKKQIKSK